MKPWSVAKRARLLKRAALLARWAARIQAKVRAHTPKRAPRLKAVEERAA